ncbi:hypothetical protein FE374_11855 [Georgenia yuyongxinii]|uniref:ATP-dependent DNA helicase II n=1 Tax=Georgenia yuyongxinii TaxID=2589797 RepID=A0A552WPQ4_9MICO|nr:hypothetical protein [Georgenia yuyongxinii]QDC25208.1 hypothetical protein FE374_11855 [Georgenia yuyongxinii]TRW44589.1 hypothetical protein FJ693_12900 [Georgenia yuyongxinii]
MSSGSRPHLANSPFNKAREAAAAGGAPIPVGEQVSHDRYGLGKVIASDGHNSVIIDFGSGNRRRVALDSPRLERL